MRTLEAGERAAEPAGFKASRCVPVLALLLAVCGCSIGDAAAQDVQYELSTGPDEEILTLASYGGLDALTPQYRLYGDGRLVREIVNKGTREAVGSQETHLGSEDIDLLFQLIVSSRLPELTAEGLQQSLGRRPIEMEDGATYVLKLRFESYQGPGQGEASAFAPEVKIHAPALQAKWFPDAPEPRGLVAVWDALDGYFPESAAEVLYAPAEEEQ